MTLTEALSKSRIAACSALAFALASCGGGGGAGLPASAPASGPAHRTKHKIKATIRITIPKRKHHRRIRVRGHYISPATASIAITVTPNGGSPTSYNANLDAQNEECTASLISPLICTISLNLDPGAYTASFATYDGLLSGAGGPTDPPTGVELSANQNAPLTIVAGQANSLNVTLDGIPVAVALVPTASSTIIGNMNIAFSASKCGSPTATTERVNVFGVDADGNYILGPGAPAPTLVSNDTAIVAVSTPGPAAPNTFILTHPISSAQQGPLQLTASVTPAADSGGSVQSNSTNFTVAGGTAICGVITEYSIPTGSSDPEGIAEGPDGDAWFTEFSGQKIGKITTGGTFTEYAVAGDAPYGIAANASDHHLWFTEAFKGDIGDITTGGTVTEHITGLNGTTGLQEIAAAATGIVWVTENRVGNDNSMVDEYSSVLTRFGPAPSGNSPKGIVQGPDGDLWFAEQNGYIGQMTTDGSMTDFSNGITGGPQYITVGADANLWFSEVFAGVIGRITTAGTVTEFPTISGGNTAGLALGPDGNVWFAESGANKIGGITTDGTITEYSVPTGNAGLNGVAAGSDGALWFTECLTNKIGRLQ